MMLSLPKFDPSKAEVTLRVGVAACLGYILSIASFPTIVPPSLAIIPCTVSSAMSVSLPMLYFSLLAMIPTLIIAMIIACGFATGLLAAATVSDELFVVVFTCFALLMISLYGGETYSSTYNLAQMFICIPALFALSFRPLVQPPRGDLATVSLMWTESGTDNYLAVWPNFLITLCWGSAASMLAMMLPPFRTSRWIIGRRMVPAALGRACAVIRQREDVGLRKELVKMWNALGDDGSIVDTTHFEPRVFTSWSEDLAGVLKSLVIAVDKCILSSLVLLDDYGEEMVVGEPDRMLLEDTIAILEDCRVALFSDGGSITFAPVDGIEDISVCASIHQSAVSVQDAAISYLAALNDPSASPHYPLKEQTMKRLKTMVMYVVPPFLPVIRLISFVPEIFQPKKWNSVAILWSLELVAGYVVLICMSVYWEGYNDFRLNPSQEYVGAVYDGWHLVAYAFAWTPTLEGTVKKGIQRCYGTLLGGFTGWLGIIIASGSIHNNVKINPYGLVAWLTFTTMWFAYSYTLEPGLKAYSGASKDYGFVGLYASTTQAIVAVEVYLGVGDKNGIALNRIVATLTGVAMAMIFQAIPPHTKGGDPKWLANYHRELKTAFVLLLNTFVDGSKSADLNDDKIRASLLSLAVKKRKYALFVFNDANQLQSWHILKVNQRIKQLGEALIVTESVISYFQDRLASLVSPDSDGKIPTQVDVNETRRGIASLLEEFASFDSVIQAKESGKYVETVDIDDVPTEKETILVPDSDLHTGSGDIVWARRIYEHLLKCEILVKELM